MKYFIFQGNDHDCGFASLKMLLSHISKNKSYLYIPKPTKREKYTLADLVNIGAKYGVELEAYGIDKQGIDEIPELSLALIDENHVILIKRKRKRTIIVYDPAYGKVRMKKEEFKRRFRSVILICKDYSCIQKIKEKPKQIINLNLRILEISSSIVSAIVLVTLFYLLNTSNDYINSLIFLGAFLLFQIIEKLILYKQVYTFDSFYIPRYFSQTKNCNKQKYLEYANYKRSFFTFNRSILSSFLVALLITFLLCANDVKNAFVLLALIMLKLLEKIAFAKKSEDSKNVIAEIESQCFKNIENSSQLALEANMKADHHIFYSSLKEIFYIFMTFLFSLLMMFTTGNSGCNFVIFHFVMYFAGFN